MGIIKVSYNEQKLDWFIVGLPVILEAPKDDFQSEFKMWQDKA